MRYLVSFVLLAALVASPLSVGAQAGEEAATPTQNLLPPQLMLRASYLLYLDADAADVPDIDTLGARSIEHYESLEHHDHFTAGGRGAGRNPRRLSRPARIAIGVIVPVAVVSLAATAAVVASTNNAFEVQR